MIIQVVTCIESFSCFPSQLLEVFDLYNIQYGIPTVLIFAFLVGIIVTAIYLHTRSLTALIVMAMYTFAVLSAMFVNDTWLEAQYHTALYVLFIAIASVITLLILRLVKE